MPTLEFDLEHIYPDEPGRNIPVPVTLEVGNASARLLAFVDTGAERCIFQSEYADILGLELRAGEQLIFSGAGGGRIEGYGHTVTIEVLDQRVESVVFFTDHPGFRRNVLGRQGWLHHFKFGLIHYESKIYLGSIQPQNR
jgi:Aspartyl protease